ncbi:acyltransferase [Halovenus rubra]|uniref:Acyltransferase n=2 Tax=Halovenus rubra TaxID=869890 RepID=A0ACC7DZD4_9EURY|nr:DapH/DapD/GlmU-related protein [Halovenus rubra]
MVSDIDDTARLVETTVGNSDIREFVTIHDSEIGDGCKIYERTSIKKSTVSDNVDINAGSYVENATIESNVQIGPNSTVAGVTHELTEDGMTFRNDVFEPIVLREGVFLGAGTVVGPGVEVGKDAIIAAGGTVTDTVAARTVVLGSPPDQQRLRLDEWRR